MQLSEITPGQQLSWHYIPRGGYGFGYNVDAEVLSVGKSRVKVRVKKVSGQLAERWVDPANLRARKG